MEYPNQKISAKKKQAVDNGIPTWYHKNAEFLAKYANEYTHLNSEIDKLIRISQGDMIAADYSYVTNPFNTKNPDYQKYPAKLQNYGIIAPVIDRHLGERRDMPDTTQVKALNYAVTNEFKEQKQKFFQAKLQEQFLAELESVQQGQPVQQPTDFKTLDAEFNSSWATRKAMKGQRMYEWIKGQKDLTEKEQELYFYWIATGRIATYKGNDNDDITYKVMHPGSVTPIMFGESKLYEDATGVRATHLMSVASIIDEFGANLKEKDLDILHKHHNDPMGENRIVYKDQFLETNRSFYKQSSSLLEVEHFTWKSLDEKIILTYIDEFGFTQKREVDEDYVFEPALGDVKIERKWMNTWHEVWRIPGTYQVSGTAINPMYLRWGKGKPQRNELNNNSICKLPYNGTFRGVDYGVIRSVTKTGLPFEKLYNIFLYRFELTLAKNKDKLLLFPIGLIPRMKGWNTDKFMYNIHAFSMAFFNEKEEKALAALQAIKEIDMSLSQYMADLWKFMQAIKEEWRDAAGFSPQRYGQIGSEAGKATTAEAIYRSAVSSKEMIGQFDYFKGKEIAGLIDHAKIAYANGVQAAYSNSRGDLIEFDISQQDIQELEYGVFVTNSAIEYEKLQEHKSLLPYFIQNKAPMSVVSQVIEEPNSHRVTALYEQGEALVRQYEMQMAEKQNEGLKYQADMDKQIADAGNATRVRVAEIAADARVEGNLIMSDSFNAPLGDADKDGVSESDEIVERSFKRRLGIASQAEKERADKAKESLQRENLALNREKMYVDFAIAKQNKNKYDKR